MYNKALQGSHCDREESVSFTDPPQTENFVPRNFILYNQEMEMVILTKENQTVRKMRPEDFNSVARIYKQSLKKGIASFTSECPDYELWDAEHHKDCRLVYEWDGSVVGFAAISPVSAKPHYSGVAEVSVYVDRKFFHKGIGTALLNSLCREADEHGYWTLYSSIFSDNIISIELHKKCGFRIVGYRERIAKDIFGNWKSTIMMERRNNIE